MVPVLNRKDLKRRARAYLKRHYLLLVTLCAVSIFLGTEFTNVGEGITDYDVPGVETQAEAAGVAAGEPARTRLDG